MVNDFTMIQGDTQYIEYTCTRLNGTGVDLVTALDVRWGFTRYGDSSQDTIVAKTRQDGLSAVNNKVTVKLFPQDTVGLDGKFQYTIRITDETGDKFSDGGLFIINIASL